MRVWFAVIALLALVAAGVTQQRRPLPFEPMRVEKVTDGLYVVRGPFVECLPDGCPPGRIGDGLLHEAGDVAVRVTPEGLILVDDKYQQHAAEVIQKVKSVSTLPIKYLLNSHHHTDHAGGNGEILKLGIEIIAHRNIRENFIRNKQPGPPPIAFNDRAEVHLGGVEVRLIYLGRGHTNGDTIIYFPDLRAIHTGDLVIDGMPVIDYAGGGSAIEFVSTLKKILDIDFDTVIPGHGRILTRRDVAEYIPKFETMNQRMADLVRKGVPKDQAAQHLKLDDLGWSNTVSTGTFLRGIERYYDEIAAQQ